MTGKELIKLLESYPEDILNREVMIHTEGPSIGPSFKNPLKTVGPGFDWDSSVFFLIPEKIVVDVKSLADENLSERYHKMGEKLKNTIK